MTPKITILLCTLNRCLLLERAIKSILMQTAPKESFELLIIDDGSKDKTEEVVSEFCKTSFSIRYLKLPKNYGLGTARRIGIRIAHYEWVVFMDDDCIADPNWILSSQNYISKNPNIVGVEGRTTTDYASVLPFKHVAINEKGGLYWGCNIFFNRKAALTAGNYDDHYKLLAEDIDFAWRLKGKGGFPFYSNTLMVHPAREDHFISQITRMKYYSGYFRLFRKLPHDYMNHMKKEPWSLIYYQIFFKGYLAELIKWKRLVFTNPSLYFKYAALLAAQRIALIYFIPFFVRVHLKVKNILPYNEKHDYSDETLEYDRKMFMKVFGKSFESFMEKI